MRARSSGRGAGPSKLTPVDAEAAAVARALELVLRRQIVRRAAEVRAGDAQRVEPARVLVDVVGRAHEPDAELFLPPLVDAHAVLVREARP